MKLYVAAASPFSRKVRIALLEKCIPCEVVVENPWSTHSAVPRLNPLAKVPVLELDDGRTIVDSPVIVEYLETLPYDPRLVPVAPGPRIEHRRLEAIADGIAEAVSLIAVERARVPDRQSNDWIARQLAKIGSGVGTLARELGDGEWFVGERYGLADIAIGCMLGHLDARMPELAWRGAAPALARFAERVFAKPAFEATRAAGKVIDTAR